MNYEDLTREELLDLATEQELSFPKNITKANLVKLLTNEPIVSEEVKETTPALTRSQLRKRANELVRINLVCHNPHREKMGTIVVSVANELVGDVIKVVPLDPAFYTNGYFLPRCIVNVLKSKVYSNYTVTKPKSGSKDVATTVLRTFPEFTIVELPLLTNEELEKLKLRQIATGSLVDEA